MSEKIRDDFMLFIISYGRAKELCTVTTLRNRTGYTGPITIIIDDQDPQAEDYHKRFDNEPGVQVREYTCKDVDCDIMDLIPGRASPIFIRRECFIMARELGKKYFLMLEDDYDGIRFRYVKDGQLKGVLPCDFNAVCNAFVDYLEKCPQMLSMTMSQNGDYIGGADKFCKWGNKMRKVMNSFFCCTDREFRFMGRTNDDICTNTNLASRGHLFLSHRNIAVNQAETQSLKGGCSETYKSFGTYVKSFYAVIPNPSCVKISTIGVSHMRIHHRVGFENCSSKVISDKYKKSNNKIKPICKEYLV